MNPGHDYIQNLADFIRRYITDLKIYTDKKIFIHRTGRFAGYQYSQNDSERNFFCVKEAVHNAIKHSGSNVVFVTMSVKEKYSGTGFQIMAAGLMLNSNTSGRTGIKNITERMSYINGSIEFLSK
ncbi:MAG: hypothetical protein IPF52_03110 [Saprospiraceae bacterium]|nr:hypothetical protein [Saprospiraceae bacterium]